VVVYHKKSGISDFSKTALLGFLIIASQTILFAWEMFETDRRQIFVEYVLD
jgi:hypothetical protein